MLLLSKRSDDGSERQVTPEEHDPTEENEPVRDATVVTSAEPVMRPALTSGVLWRLLAVFVFAGSVTESATAQVSADWLAGMSARSVGPAGGTGRISAIDALVSNPNVIYVGASAGGVWRSVNGGQTWRAVFDGRPVSDIGAVVVNQASPNVVWVGIGEGNGTGDAAAAAVYRSLDGGDTWAPMGLSGLEGVYQLVLHPANAGIVYAGVSGVMWEDGEGRGIYRTTDGGQTWTRVLHVDARTGVSDLIMDPSNPDRLLAAMWSSRGHSWSVEPRGPGSGLFLTTDAGDSWIRLDREDGLPAGDLGRMTLDVFRGDPRVLHALVDAGEGELLRSYNRGRIWQRVPRSPNLISSLDHPSEIIADPLDESRLLHLSDLLSVSEDGGVTFRNIGPASNPGFRTLWMHPEDPRLLYGGTDGGLYVSRDAGENWRPMGDLPLARLDRVAVDMESPFNVYGGLGGNGSWLGPAYGWTRSSGGDGGWAELGSDDGFGILVEPDAPGRGYTVAAGGELIRFNTRTGERKHVRPWAPEFADLRLNRETPIALDPHNPEGIYYGSQFVHKSATRGETWQIISGDLTTADPAGRGTITVIAPSPVDPDVIWVGTDEGDVQLTRSAGGEWESVRNRIRDVPDSSWVTHIEAAVSRPGSAFVTFDAHRTGDRRPLVFWTDNYGRDWRNLARESGLEGVVHVVEQDPTTEDLLFAGTEAGLYVSLNRGEDWIKWVHGLPPAPVRDVVLHPRDHDLVVGTHGRGAYVIDDIRPLRELSRNPRNAELELILFEPATALIGAAPAPAVVDAPEVGSGLRGQDRPRGALLTYWVGRGFDGRGGGADDVRDGADADAEPPGVDVEILDFDGRVVRTLRGPARPGINRISWDLREDPPTLSGALSEFSDASFEAEGGRRSVEVLPGTYTARLSREGTESFQLLEVATDGEGADIELVDRIAKYQAVERGLELETRLGALRAATTSVQNELRRVSEVLRGRGSIGDAELIETGEGLAEELRTLTDFRGVTRYRPGVLALSSSYDAPTEGQRLDLIRMEEELDVLMRRIGDFLILDINGFARRLFATGLETSFFIGPIG